MANQQEKFETTNGQTDKQAQSPFGQEKPTSQPDHIPTAERPCRPQVGRHYKYKPLKGKSEFRLLKLKAGEKEDPLICDLEHFDRLGRHTPSYEAISYVWGPASPSEPIICNGDNISITPSLNNALRRIRVPSDTIYVWADAICIDQSDLRERKMQVDLMRLIYANATIVSVCLQGEVYWPVRTCGVPSAIFPASLTRLSASKGIAEFFDNPWFSRIWVVQEVAESKKARVLFGDQEIAWQHVVDLATRVLREPESRATILRLSKTRGIQNALVMNNNISIASPDPIPRLLQSTRDFAATDPRDKVYAMLHRPIRKPRRYIEVQFLQCKHYFEFFAQAASLSCLLSVCLEHDCTDIRFWYLMLSLGAVVHHLRFPYRIHSIAFDYFQRLADFVAKLERISCSKFPAADTIFNMLEIQADYSLTAPSVYRAVATRLIGRTRKLNILSYVTHGAAIDTMYPSWVPRWDMPTGGVQILTAFPNHGYQASLDMQHTLHISPNPADHLMVEGICFSNISLVSDVISQTWFQGSNPDQPALENARALALKEQDRRAYIATLTTGRVGNVGSEHSTFRMTGRMRKVLRSQPTWPRRPVATVAPRACYGRRPFAMDNGAVGIGPAAMQTKDIVCVLFGGCVPYILRATDTDGLYRIVGESYVQGIMLGEVIQEWKAGKFAKQRFTLC